MGLAESNQVVNSYLEGLRNTLSRQQLAMEQQRIANEQEYRNQELTERKSEQQEAIRQFNVKQVADKAAFALNVKQHLSELAANGEPDVDQATGKPIVDQQGIGQYTVTGPDGNPFTFKAPTREQQANIALLNAKREEQAKSDIEKQRQLEVQAPVIAAENQRNLQTQAFEAHNQALERDLRNKISQNQIAAENGRNKADIASRTLIAQIEQGYTAGPGTGNGGGAGNSSDATSLAGQVATHVFKVLHGEETEKDLSQLKPGVKQQVINGVIAAGGVITKQKDIDSLKRLAQVIPFFSDSKDAISQQPDINPKDWTAKAQALVRGEFQNKTDATTAQKFNLLSGAAPNIATTLGGDEGQRLTDAKIQMSNGAFTPRITDVKSANIQKYNNGIQKTLGYADAVLANYPPAQRAMIQQQYAFHTLQPFGQGSPTAPNGQPTVAPTGQPQYPDPNSFFLNH